MKVAGTSKGPTPHKQKDSLQIAMNWDDEKKLFHYLLNTIIDGVMCQEVKPSSIHFEALT